MTLFETRTESHQSSQFSQDWDVSWDKELSVQKTGQLQNQDHPINLRWLLILQREKLISFGNGGIREERKEKNRIDSQEVVEGCIVDNVTPSNDPLNLKLNY